MATTVLKDLAALAAVKIDIERKKSATFAAATAAVDRDFLEILDKIEEENKRLDRIGRAMEIVKIVSELWGDYEASEQYRRVKGALKELWGRMNGKLPPKDEGYKNFNSIEAQLHLIEMKYRDEWAEKLGKQVGIRTWNEALDIVEDQQDKWKQYQKEKNGKKQ